MRFRRLGWAGLEIESSGERLVIDHIADAGILTHFLGDSPEPLLAPEPGTCAAALVTHLHRDHADPGAIDRALRGDGVILRPAAKRLRSELDDLATGEAEAALEQSAHEVRECGAGDRHEIGPFSIVALFASDGLGAHQVSWLVEADDRRLLHAGDTLWHGAWWDFAVHHGPIDVACLPANGAVINYPKFQPAAEVGAVMGPDEAVGAARALAAGVTVPIHHTAMFDHPEFYRPVADAPERLAGLAAEAGVRLELLEPGKWSC